MQQKSKLLVQITNFTVRAANVAREAKAAAIRACARDELGAAQGFVALQTGGQVRRRRLAIVRLAPQQRPQAGEEARGSRALDVLHPTGRTRRGKADIALDARANRFETA